MIVLRNKSFSRLQDEDYYEKHNDRKKSVKHAKRNTAIAGGTIGGLTGAYIGAATESIKGVKAGGAIGATAGAVGGYYLGKKIKKDTEKDADNKMARYRKASEKDKKYIREKEERDEMKELEKRKARAQEQMAWNSWRK